MLITGYGTPNNTELFLPAYNIFLNPGSMRESRFCHTATALLDGRVLVVGGSGAIGNELFVPASQNLVPVITAYPQDLTLSCAEEIPSPENNAVVATSVCSQAR